MTKKPTAAEIEAAQMYQLGVRKSLERHWTGNNDGLADHLKYLDIIDNALAWCAEQEGGEDAA